MDTSVEGSSPSTITHWTLIVRAQGSGPAASKALGELLTRHRRFILWLIRAHGYPSDSSPEDLFQECTLHLVRRGDIGRLEKHGNLRSWLKRNVRWFLCNEWDKWKAHRQLEVIPVETLQVEAPDDRAIDAAFFRDAIIAALDLARASTSNSARFKALERFLPGPQLDLAPYGPIARQLGMNEIQLRKAIYDERKHYERCLDEVISNSMDVGDDAQDPVRLQRRVGDEKRRLLLSLEQPECPVVRRDDGDPS